MNKVERIQAVIKRETVDYVPAGFWFHYSSDYTVEEMIDAHMKLYNETGMDIIKIMQDYSYPISGKITCAQDWYNIKIKGVDSEEFEKMAAVIKGIRARAGEDVLLIQTMFGPFKAASIAFGEDVLMKYSKEAPEAVIAGIKIIADGLEQWAKGYLEVGADGIYYSAQYGELGRFTKKEWEELVKPFDLQILNVAEQIDGKYNILHICGEPEYDFETHVDRFGDYPADLVNWSVKDNGYSLERGRDFFKAGILGGMDNKGNVLKGPKEKIEEEVKSILDRFGTTGIMIGADCTIQGENIRLDYIKAAVDAAHNYQK
mgnify:FL=1